MKLRGAIIATLTYSDHFAFPLRKDELYTRLIGISVSPVRLARELAGMVQKKAIGQTGEYYYLPGHKSHVIARQKSEIVSAAKLVRTKKIIKLLALHPHVLAVYVTGSLAVGNAKPGDDLDLLIVTKNGRLWTTRLGVTVLLGVLGLRRHPEESEASDKVCCNLWLTPCAFSVPPKKRSLYSAYELLQAQPLYDPRNTERELLSANTWIKNYVPNFEWMHVKLVTQRTESSWLAAQLETLAYHLQRAYMKKKLTKEFITKDSAYFHPQNPGSRVLRDLAL